MGKRLDQLERVLSEQEWLVAERFTVADLLMADVLRVSEVRSFGDRPATEAYVTRATDRPSFKKAQADQIGHFEAADQKKEQKKGQTDARLAPSIPASTLSGSRLFIPYASAAFSEYPSGPPSTRTHRSELLCTRTDLLSFC